MTPTPSRPVAVPLPVNGREIWEAGIAFGDALMLLFKPGLMKEERDIRHQNVDRARNRFAELTILPSPDRTTIKSEGV